MSDDAIVQRVRQKLLSECPKGVDSGKDTQIWEISGEDPNCDLGGYHHEPHLATVRGTYDDAVEYALELSGFIGWGSGGSVTMLAPARKPIDISGAAGKRYRELRKELLGKKKKLEIELKKLNAELGIDE